MVASMPDTSAVKRIVISSKKRCKRDHQCPVQGICRKSEKECYCNVQSKKVPPRLTRTQQRQQAYCKRCKCCATLNVIPIENHAVCSPLDSPISCDTLRRVQTIDYAPRSQFLRNVRSKVSHLQEDNDREVFPEVCHRSQNYQKPVVTRNAQDDVFERVHAHRLAKMLDKTTQTSNGELTKPARNIPEHETERSESKVATRISESDIRKKKSSGKLSSEHKRTRAGHEHLKYDLHPNGRAGSKGSRSQEKSDDTGGELMSDREMRELRKFREQNYFDTHGSSYTLSSSKSASSLEQYLLNDRLFPEPVGRISSKNLVVTMPPCASTQLKRVHYLPRYMVPQEKHNFSTNGKKKHCNCCPLTGHAIDLGVSKTRLPLNSLALKYQKRLP